MVILYVFLIVYIAAVNFYAFLFVKTLREKEQPTAVQTDEKPEDDKTQQTGNRYIGKLLATGALGGAITIYVCMFVFKWRRNDMLLMILMPLLGVLNVYLWIMLCRAGMRFF